MQIKQIYMIILSFSLIYSQPYGLEERVPNNSLLISTGGDTLADMDLKRVFTNLDFTKPVYLIHSGDQSDRLFVVEKRGIIKVFPNDITTSESGTFLDIRSRVNDGPSEAGLLSVAFHPSYLSNGKFYVNYTYGSLVSRVSEFTTSANPDSADHDSERILLELDQPYNNHNGGQIAFGPDGYLYIGFGDGGSGGDPKNNGQDTNTLHGAILRIDVDTQTDSTEYGIPADNPFVDNPQQGRPEIWAWGLRNPWRFSFDPLNGNLWAGDVGQNKWEEIDLIKGGKNYGWNIMEGFHCYGSSGCDTTGLALPVIEYSHSQGESVTGGFVYRSQRIARLEGVYIYGDYVSAKIWGLKYAADSLIENKLIAESPALISSFGQDEAGEVYVVGYDGRIYQFEEKEDTPPLYPVPEYISESGLYSDMEDRTLSPGIIPYSVKIPFWSDGAEKERFIALPGTSQIVFSKNGFWEFPSSSVIAKNYYLQAIEGDAVERRLIETRFLVRDQNVNRWSGFSYWWDDDGSDAYLLDSSAVREFTVIRGDSTITQKWYYPSRSECLACHTPAAGYILGLRTAQINKNHDYNAITDNQLRSYNHIDLFTEDIGEDYSGFPQFPELHDSLAGTENRARAYMDVNCANCHRSGGSGRTNMDLRYDIALEDAQLIGAHATLDDLGLGNPLRINPGKPDSSIVYLRMIRNGELRMPPLASFIIDEEGAGIVKSWIDSLGQATSLNEKTVQHRPRDLTLYPAYPNPFNARTAIRFFIPETERVSLNLVNIRGQKLRQIMDTELPAGHHEVSLNGNDLASGVYIIWLRSGGSVRNKKIVLLK